MSECVGGWVRGNGWILSEFARGFTENAKFGLDLRSFFSKFLEFARGYKGTQEKEEYSSSLTYPPFLSGSLPRPEASAR